MPRATNASPAVPLAVGRPRTQAAIVDDMDIHRSTHLQPSRRTLLRTGLATGTLALAGASVVIDSRPSAPAVVPAADPFPLGVASGDPAPDGFVIWTRLAVEPLAADGLGGMPSGALQVKRQGRP